MFFILGQFYEQQVFEKFSYMVLCLIKELGLDKYAKKGEITCCRNK